MPETFVCQSVAILRPAQVELAQFLELYLVSEENGQKDFERHMYGQGRPHLSFDQLRSTSVPLPPLAEQARIVNEVQQVLSGVEEQNDLIGNALIRCNRMRQSILMQAFAGALHMDVA